MMRSAAYPGQGPAGHARPNPSASCGVAASALAQDAGPRRKGRRGALRDQNERCLETSRRCPMTSSPEDGEVPWDRKTRFLSRGGRRLARGPSSARTRQTVMLYLDVDWLSWPNPWRCRNFRRDFLPDLSVNEQPRKVSSFEAAVKLLRIFSD